MGPSPQLQMLQMFLAVVSILVGILTIATTIVLVTKFLVNGSTQAKFHLEKLTAALDKLAAAVEKGFDKVHEEIEIVKVDTALIDRRVVRIEAVMQLDDMDGGRRAGDHDKA